MDKSEWQSFAFLQSLFNPGDNATFETMNLVPPIVSCAALGFAAPAGDETNALISP